jgi:SAM-dependent methyltransferase
MSQATPGHEERQPVTDIANGADALLFEQGSATGSGSDPGWISQIPDGLWLKPEEMAAPEARVIWQALDLVPGQEVLDCPCGDGRVGIHLARRGIRYTGLDINPRFIRRARERFAAEGVAGSFLLRDMRELDDEERFDAVLNWFNSFGYYDAETDLLVLQRLAMALRTGGRLLLEAPNRSNLAGDAMRTFDIGGIEIVRQWDEPSKNVLYLLNRPAENGRTVKIVSRVRLYSLSEYRQLFSLAGMQLEQVCDETLASFREHSRRMILVGRKSRHPDWRVSGQKLQAFRQPDQHQLS